MMFSGPHQFLLSVERLTAKQIEEKDKLFKDAGWTVNGQVSTFGPHSFRLFLWERPEIEPVFPVGHEPHKDR